MVPPADGRGGNGPIDGLLANAPVAAGDACMLTELVAVLCRGAAQVLCSHTLLGTVERVHAGDGATVVLPCAVFSVAFSFGFGFAVEIVGADKTSCTPGP